MIYRALPLLLLLSALPCRAAERRVALVVGSTRAPGNLAPLKYADDDAVLFAELFESAGFDRVVLLTLADDETQRRHPEAIRHARPATREGLAAAARSLFDELRRYKEKGDSTDFLFVFAGHGQVGDDGQGTLLLEDAAFTRTDLYDSIVGASPADYTHVILDACASYLVVQRRGEGAMPAAAARLSATLANHELSAHPSTGVLVSTSSGAAVHEWSGFEAGIFSHLVRSALRGAADVDGDGAITYGEVAAYLAAAREGVNDPEARIDPYVAAPARDLRRPLLRLSSAHAATFLRLSSEQSGRGYIEDGSGVRLADFHKAQGSPLVLLVPSGPSYVTLDGRLFALRPKGSGVIDLKVLPSEAVGLLPRSVGEAVAARLYAAAFGWEFYRGFMASAPQLGSASLPHGSFADAFPTADLDLHLKTRLSPYAWGSAGVAIGAAAGSAVFGALAQRSFDGYVETIARQGIADPVRAAEVRTRRNVSNVLLGTAIISAGTAAVLFYLDRDAHSEPRLASSDSFMCAGAATLCFSWGGP